MIIVASLALYLVIGVIMWSWMILVGVPAPDAFTTIIAAIAGALAGIVTPLQGPSSRSSTASGSDDPASAESPRAESR